MKKTPIISLVILLLLLSTLACSLLNQGAATETPAGATPAVVAPTATTPSEATPPPQTPTIPIPTPSEQPPAAEATRTPPPAAQVEVSAKPAFAEYREPAVDVVPAIDHAPIAPDLSNVTVPFVLSEAQRARLAQDGVVVSPGTEKEFFTVYEQARYANLPVFVTSDSLLHVYHLLFDKVLRTAEREAFIPLLRDLNAAMLAQTDAQYQALQGTGWEEAARRTVAFIGVGSTLLDDSVEIPAYAADLVEAEVALVQDAAGIMPSPLFPGLQYGEDYTQYIPRGHYTRSEELSNYFRSMMWYGRMTFRLKTNDPDVGRAETRSALLLVHALRTAQVDGQPALDAWLDLYNPTVFFVGRSDDLTALQYLDVMDAVYGPDAAVTDLVDEAKLDTFIETANQLPPPQILGIVIMFDQDVEETTKGFRFMGQRFVPDAYIFRQLIFRNVGTLENPRLLPKGLDVMAAMGSERAYTILDEMGETEYQNYPEQMAAMQDWTASLTVDEWTETLYTSWLYTFYPLLEEPGAGTPQFMQSQAWVDKQLNASLGSWAELKHDTILYAKQVYAELGGGGSGAPTPRLLNGYVEPVPHFYARLSALTEMTLRGLGDRDLLGDQDADSLTRLKSLADAFQVMAEKELRGERLTEDEYYLIRFYGGELEHLTMAAADVEEAGEEGVPALPEDPQAAVIADVATAPDPGIVLEEAVGRINEIYVVAPMIDADGTLYLQVAKGGVFSYYEFPWPIDDRLTDEAWREMLDAGEAPPLPEWTSSFFTPETEQATFQAVIYSFQRSLSEAYWTWDTTYLPAGESVITELQTTLNALADQGQYIGHQWLSADYRSFDRQSEDTVVVTVRETWDDVLYELTGGYPDGETPLAERGPYTLDVTYTLTREETAYGDQWTVTNVVYANEAPEWE